MEIITSSLSGLAGGFATTFLPLNFAMVFTGVTLGLIVGVLPGLGGTSGVAILLPLTVFIAGTGPEGDTAAVTLLAGLYWGAIFGGVVTSILFNIPGEPWSVALLFDGYPLAKRRGRPGFALTAAFMSSIFGALIASVLFTFFMVPLADVALSFGPPELLAVFLMAFATLVSLESSSPLKSVAMIGAGLLISAIGFDTITGAPRLTFGQIGLLQGVGFVPVTIGLFGIGEILTSAEATGTTFVSELSARLGLQDIIASLREIRRRIWLLVANTLIGFWIGVLPGTGATPASFLSYGIARQYASREEKAKFGTGEVAGVIAPQASANAAGIGALLPMVALGVPGSPTAAVILAGLYIWGLQPGPTLFIQRADFVWGLIASIYVGNLLAFALCLLAVPLLASIMRIPYAVITPFIVIFSIIGAYSINNSMLDVFYTLIFGVIGYWLRKMKYPLAPLVVALVLGDSTERAFRQSMIAGGGSMGIFVSSPLSAVLFLIAIALFLLPLAQLILRRRGRGAPAPDAPSAET
jgi:putative tricarboxylic transport membrane protein